MYPPIFNRLITYLGVHFVRHSVSVPLQLPSCTTLPLPGISVLRHAPIKETNIYFLQPNKIPSIYGIYLIKKMLTIFSFHRSKIVMTNVQI